MMPGRRRRRGRSLEVLDGSSFRACVLWIGRILANSNVYRNSALRISMVDDEVLEALGLSTAEIQTRGLKETRRILRDAVNRLEETTTAGTPVLRRNVGLLAEALGLSETEREILVFVAAATVFRSLRDVVSPIDDAPADQLVQLVSEAVRLPLPEVRKALGAESRLVGSGLIRMVKDDMAIDGNPLRLAEPVAASILASHRSVNSLLARCFRKAPASRLKPTNFRYLGQKLEILVKYLTACLRDQSQGVNILLHGAPGVGKTELARVLAKASGGALFEVLCQSSDGRAPGSFDRMESYTLCQSMLGKTPASMVLFDEAEDVFPLAPMPFFGGRQPGRGDKGYMVDLLENNPVPAIWIVNQIKQIDPAFLRRFDLVAEIRVPPRAVREGMLVVSFSRMPVRRDWIRKMSQAEQLTPADVDRAAKVLGMIGTGNMESNEKLTEEILRSNLGARRLSLSGRRVSGQDSLYDLSYLNTTENISEIARGLVSRQKGTVLLYGPPGTGKTAFAFHVGELAKRSVLVRRASDLLSMWLGETEANIAQMFKDADSEQRILLLDEADSFLGERRNATRSWEVTQVNELLVQMENFDGLFICSTNLLDRLDQAVFRRFAMKIRFDYPTSEQRWRLFLAHARELGLPIRADEAAMLQRGVEDLAILTPGDFAVVRRKHALLEHLQTARMLLNALTEECSIKPEARKSPKVGFWASGTAPGSRRGGS